MNIKLENMKQQMKQQKGITMMALVITIVILLILAGISIDGGVELIEKTKLENLKTNMMLIQAKTKEYVEEANFESGKDKVIDDEVKAELIGTEIQDKSVLNQAMLEQCSIENGLYYKLDKQDLKEMGLDKIEMSEQSYYIIVYDIENITVDVLNTKGYTTENDDTYYTLSKLKEI